MSKNLNVLLREFVRQVLREAFENPPAADNKNRRDAFLGLLKPEIARGKSYPDNEQFVDQGEIAQQIFDFIDKNKNKEFEQDEIPNNEVWREKVTPLLQQLFGYRLMKMRSGVRTKK